MYDRLSGRIPDCLLPNSVEITPPLYSKPFVPPQSLVVAGINNGILRLREPNSAERIPIAYPAIGQDRGDEQPVKPPSKTECAFGIDLSASRVVCRISDIVCRGLNLTGSASAGMAHLSLCLCALVATLLSARGKKRCSSTIGRTCAFESKIRDFYVTAIAVSSWHRRNKKSFRFFDFWLQTPAHLIEISRCSLADFESRIYAD